MARKLYCRAARLLWEKGNPKPYKKRYKYPYVSQMKKRNKPVDAKRRWESATKPKKFKRFMKLPEELKAMVWDNALSKPGIHFFAAVVTPPNEQWDSTNPLAWLPQYVPADWVAPVAAVEEAIPPDIEILVSMMKGRGTEEGGVPKRTTQMGYAICRGLHIRLRTEIPESTPLGPLTQLGHRELYFDDEWAQTPPEQELHEEIKQHCGLIRLVEPEEGRPSGSFLTAGQSFPPGCVSAYKTYDSLKHISSTSEAAAWKAKQEFDKPLEIPLGNGKTATIDAARDLVYVKFFKWYSLPNSIFGQTAMYSRSPSHYHHQREHYSFSGIRRVAVEIDEGWTLRCARPIALRRRGACYCRASRTCHSAADEDAIKKLVSFLRCFPDLEHVYLVFDSNPLFYLEPGLRRRYTTFGPVGRMDGTTTRRHYKWTKREGDTFYCPGGVLREASRPMDRICLLVDYIHWHYHQLDAQNHTDRMNAVKFRTLGWE